ncbi:secreted RxLR effector peptide protein, putative [Phytophthora infestans T30-4]|uniref:Secreted RxLR effector peptide protein, putative n=1 Tax=Phytophthora infestans (strain T30-4) TaxID=403677 RepID=D0N0F4_PHYIT|nr:secreted RxLR effector peptide protein, putative [Phytophthora infestans T30-4]EEY67117.1 secreted RxLR effector peptide protein, putative [Phytophthora infestans T30-4]|eukprot:XP_002905765.1 secreted RxLR effector peptide protein, putative [Phytophthora infestans T30-4]
MRHVAFLLAGLVHLRSLDVASAANSIAQRERYLQPLGLPRSGTPPNQEERNAINILNNPVITKLRGAAKWSTSKISDKAKVGAMRFQGKTADEAFTLLKLDQAGDKLLENKQFSVWVSYMTKINKKHPKTAIVTALTARSSDERLATMLEAARKVDATSGIATKLQVAHMKVWLREKTSMDAVLKFLTLDKGVDSLLTNPSFTALETYVRLFNKQNPGKETSVIKELMVFYGDEAVSKMLEAAKKVPNTHAQATALQNAQFKLWFAEGAKPSRIWKMLNMKKASWTTNPDAQVWRGYLDYYKLQKAAAVST